MVSNFATLMHQVEAAGGSTAGLDSAQKDVLLAGLLAERPNLAHREDRFRSLFQRLPVGMALLDDSGAITMANQRLSEMLCQGAAALQGRKLADFVAASDSERFAAFRAEIKVKGHAPSCELRLNDRKRTQTIMIEGVSLPRNEFGDQQIVAAIDISDRKRLELEILENRLDLECDLRSHDEFLSDVSFELRTPISGIIGVTEMILGDKVLRDQKEYLEMIKESARSLLSIANDLVDFGRPSPRQTKTPTEDFDLTRLLTRIIARHEAEAEAKGLFLRLTTAPGLPAEVHGPKARIAQIVTTLLSNSLDNTMEGGIAVDVRSSGSGGQSPHRVTITVSDTGRAFAPELLPRLFDPFACTIADDAGNTRTNRFGLAIAKRLSDSVRGELTVQSAATGGSSISFSLEMQPPRSVMPDESAAVAAVQANAPLNILLAEDNPANELYLTYFLSLAGHKVVSVGNGAEALEALQNDVYDVVLMDIQMPVMDGLEATRTIRSGSLSGVDKDVPIIALTAHVKESDKASFLRAGMNDYAAKPVDAAALEVVMERVLTGAERPALSRV